MYKEKIDLGKLPKHVAIIMDGNGRWAKRHGKPRVFGHKNGVRSVRDAVEASAEIGVEFLTLYAFSTENWKRPKFEVDALMTLLVSSIKNEINTLNDNNVRLLAIGNLDSLPKNVRKELQWAIDSTSTNTGLSLVLALSYSSRWEIIDAVKKISEKVKNDELNVNDISDEIFTQNLFTANIPDPELLIRTSGESRVSNFLLWQIAYTELFFIDKLWPDFGKEDLFEIIFKFQNRERRFGKTSEQINSNTI